MARHLALLALLRPLFCRHDWERTDMWDADFEYVVVRCRECGREMWSTWTRAGPPSS